MNVFSCCPRRSGVWWKKLPFFLFAAVLAGAVSGCATEEKLSSEDLEVPQFYGHLIEVLKNPNIRPNSREKYEAAKELISKVDFTLTYELKTLNELLYHGDAIVDTPDRPDRTIVFYYPWQGHYVRLTFYVYGNMVLRVKVDEK